MLLPSNLGRVVFGAAIIACGVVTLAWHGSAMSSVIGIGQCAGGIAILFDRSAKAGAAIVGVVYLATLLLSVPQLVSNPRVYWTWGNLFYPLALVIGAAIVFVRCSHPRDLHRVARISCVLFGLCAASYGIEQGEFLARTASLVPAWIPPTQMFWAIATCIPFALAAIALITGRLALLAAQLFALMMLLFGIVVWIPILIANPYHHGNWSEATETVAIAGAAWILAELLATFTSPVRSA